MGGVARIEDTGLVDQVFSGSLDSEESHDQAGDRSVSGTGPQGRKWRDADPDGWFSFTLANASGADLDLICTWWGGDKERTFDIIVNGRKVASQELNGSQPGTFFETIHPIPPVVLAGQQNVNIRFQGIGKGRAGGVFGVRLQRRPEAGK